MPQHRRLACLVAALAFSAWLAGCSGGQEEAAPLDLGGGLSMTADGQILDTPWPAASGTAR